MLSVSMFHIPYFMELVWKCHADKTLKRFFFFKPTRDVHAPTPTLVDGSDAFGKNQILVGRWQFYKSFKIKIILPVNR